MFSPFAATILSRACSNMKHFMKNKYMELFAVEYSPTQNTFHIETIERAIEINLGGAIFEKRKLDYILVGIAESHEEARELYKAIKEKLDKNEPPTTVSLESKLT
ncbi:MAG: hypothetical protein WBB28_25820 [Crinalium sp.]